jgi:mono/diheme cytochrome c family protein
LTEIPEHLLKRSRERRSAMGLSGEGAEDAPAAPSAAESTDADADAPTAAVAVPAAAAVAEVEPPKPPPPMPRHIEAYHRRRRIPFWAMPVLIALPLWAYLFQGTLEPPPAGASDPLVIGEQIYTAKCSSCHGARGGGGSGPSFQNGAVLQTWPSYKDHIEWVHLGSQGWPGTTYGAQNKTKKGGMPAWKGVLTDEQIILVVRYEREVLGGGKPEPELVTLSEEAAKKAGGSSSGGH